MPPVKLKPKKTSSSNYGLSGAAKPEHHRVKKIKANAASQYNDTAYAENGKKPGIFARFCGCGKSSRASGANY